MASSECSACGNDLIAVRPHSDRLWRTPVATADSPDRTPPSAVSRSRDSRRLHRARIGRRLGSARDARHKPSPSLAASMIRPRRTASAEGNLVHPRHGQCSACTRRRPCPAAYHASRYQRVQHPQARTAAATGSRRRPRPGTGNDPRAVVALPMNTPSARSQHRADTAPRWTMTLPNRVPRPSAPYHGALIGRRQVQHGARRARPARVGGRAHECQRRPPPNLGRRSTMLMASISSSSRPGGKSSMEICHVTYVSQHAGCRSGWPGAGRRSSSIGRDQSRNTSSPTGRTPDQHAACTPRFRSCVHVMARRTSGLAGSSHVPRSP